MAILIHTTTVSIGEESQLTVIAKEEAVLDFMHTVHTDQRRAL